MYWGKTLGSIFSSWNWGSHVTVNREAYNLLSVETKKDRRISLLKNFPTWKQINVFEGFNGADGLWLEGKWSSSSMHYNPVNGQGEAPQGVRKNYYILKKILNKRRTKLNVVRAARRAAYLSHLISDCLNPPHHYGRYANFKIRYYWYLIKSDWKEEGIRGVKKGVRLEKYHRKFEQDTLFKLMGNDFGPIGIKYDFIKDFQQQTEDKHLFIQENIKTEIKKIHELDIYRKYIEHGWTKEVEQAMAQQVFPVVISWVATYWLLALLESKQIKY